MHGVGQWARLGRTVLKYIAGADDVVVDRIFVVVFLQG